MASPGTYPRGAPRPTTSRAEQAFHRALSAQIPKGWYAWHSLRVRVGSTLEGEGDFVLAIPDRGILVVEIKGGAIEIRDGHWLQNGRRMARPPRDQAHGYAGKLRAKIEAAYNGRCPWIAIATAFPDTPFSRQPSEGAVAGAVLGQQDLGYLKEALNAIAARLFEDVAAPRDGRWIGVLHALWCETWTPTLGLGDRARLREQELIALDADQLQLLDCVEQNKRLLVTGGPGTGKTLVARELYTRMTQRDGRPLLLCSTSALAAGLRRWGLEEAWTVREHAARLLERAGIALQDGAPRSMWTAETWELAPLHAAADALDSAASQHDAVIVDEGQDLSDDDWELVNALADDGTLWVFADAGQGFWSDRGVPANMLSASFTLMKRYRCPEPLARFADAYRCNASLEVEGPIDELKIVNAPTTNMIAARVDNEIRKLLSEGTKPGDIAVLSLAGQTRTTLGTADRIGATDVVRADSTQADEFVIADTFLRFKGLERPWVIVCELSLGQRQYDVRMHVALTRATVGCVVVATPEVIAADARVEVALRGGR